jgi:CheY-like chemotaxis protein
VPQVTVLIVDDAAVIRRLARKLLERRGYTVVAEADCAATALSLADVLLPDAVLLMTADPQLGHYAMLDRSGACGLVAKADLAGTDLGAFWPVP